MFRRPQGRHGFREPNAQRLVSAVLAWSLSFLFALRVAGQALQRWMPVTWLPPFGAFQGSNLPYWLLLTSQLLILALMVRFSWRVHAGSLVPNRRAGTVLAWAGGLYLMISIGRIAVGLLVVEAPAWFKAWISAVFHVVLAIYVLTLAAYHLQQVRAEPESSTR